MDATEILVELFTMIVLVVVALALASLAVVIVAICVGAAALIPPFMGRRAGAGTRRVIWWMVAVGWVVSVIGFAWGLSVFILDGGGAIGACITAVAGVACAIAGGYGVKR